MEVDETDRAILHVLQRLERPELTTADIAEHVDVSASTVSNRIHQLEADGILRGSIPDIDYQQAGLPHHLLFVCTVPIPDRKDIARDVLDMSPVVTTRELLTGARNLHIEALCLDNAEIEEVEERLDEFDLTINRTDILARERRRPLDHFSRDLEK